MGGGVRLKRSCSSLAVGLRVKDELAEEELRSSLKLKSELPLLKLPSLSALTMRLRFASSSSISTVIMGGGACRAELDVGASAAERAGGGGGGRGRGRGCSEKSREWDLCLFSGLRKGEEDLEGEPCSRFP